LAIFGLAMQIEDADKFKVWLTATLEPLCDADPGDLSKYVLALIKKKRSSDEMKESLDVFLQAKTTNFVDKLFAALESKEYLNFTPPSPAKDTKTTDGATEDATNAGKDENEAPIENNGNEKANEANKHIEPDRKESSRRRDSSPRRRSPPPRRRVDHRRGSPPRRFRSRSPYDRRRSPPGGYRGRRGRSPPPPPSHYHRGGPRSRSRSYSPPPVRRSAVSRLSPPLPQTAHPEYIPTARQRCRDYDEKGFCMLGDSCKYDHGSDAVVIEDSAGVPAYNPSDPSIGGGSAKPDLTVPPPGYTEPYIPSVASAVSTFSVPPPGYPAPDLSRKRGRYDDAGPPTKIRGGMGGRGRGRGGGAGNGPPFVAAKGCTQLAVRNIPPSLNNIGLMNNHFGRFGTLTNVQVHYEGDPASALISFSSPMEAESAMNSSEAVLANRFIRVFYHQDKPKVHQRLGGPLTGGLPPSLPANEDPNSPEVQKQKELQKAADIAAIKKNQEVLQAKLAMKKNMESRKIENMNKIKEISKGKQELLEKQMAEQKKLISMIEEKKESMKPEERAMVMGLIKNLADQISKTKEDLQKLVLSSNKRSAADIQKDLLDAELELFNAQQEGSEHVADIQKKVNVLSIEAAKQGLLPTSRGRGGGAMARGGRGYYNPRGGRGGYYNPRGGGGFRGGRGGRGGGSPAAFATSVDRRPSKLKIAGFETDDKEAVINGFKRFGEILEIVEVEDSNSVVLQFKTRREAEMAMAGGKTFGDQLIQVTWFTGSMPGELQTQVSTADGAADVSVHSDAGGSVHDVSDLGAGGELEDDYTPLDPAYLPPGLDQEGGTAEKKDLDESNPEDILNEGGEDEDENVEDEINEDLLEEDDDDEEDEEVNWKRSTKE